MAVNENWNSLVTNILQKIIFCVHFSILGGLSHYLTGEKRSMHWFFPLPVSSSGLRRDSCASKARCSRQTLVQDHHGSDSRGSSLLSCGSLYSSTAQKQVNCTQLLIFIDSHHQWWNNICDLYLCSTYYYYYYNKQYPSQHKSP